MEREIRNLANRALAMDPENASARVALRSIDARTWRWSAFVDAVRPADEPALTTLELWVYSWMGRRDEAVRIGRRVVALNPIDPGAHLSLGVAYAYAGDRDASLESLARATDLQPDFGLAHVWLAFNYVALGRDDEALAVLRLVEQLLGDNRQFVYLPELAYAYSRLGQSDDVQRLMDEMRALSEADLGAGAWAVAFLAGGDEESALEQLEIVAERARDHEPDAGFINAMNLKMNYLDDPRLEQPEFVDVLSRITGD